MITERDLKYYKYLLQEIDLLEEGIKAIETRLMTVSSPRVDGMPHAHTVTDGAYRVSIESTICPNCGRKMSVIISAVDSDWARCNCGTNVIFRNQGRRKGWLQAWRDGEVAGK